MLGQVQRYPRQEKLDAQCITLQSIMGNVDRAAAKRISESITRFRCAIRRPVAGIARVIVDRTRPGSIGHRSPPLLILIFDVRRPTIRPRTLPFQCETDLSRPCVLRELFLVHASWW